MTRQTLTLKWVFYALWSLVFLLAQQLLLPRITIGGVHPFVLPAMAAIAASFEERREGPAYALVLGLVCDTLLPGVFPCFYAITLTASAALAHLAARHLIMPGVVCSLAVSVGALLITDLFNITAFTYSTGTPLSASLWLTAREILLSLPFAMVVHLVFYRVHRRFSGQ